MSDMLTEIKVADEGREDAQKGADFLKRATSLRRARGGLFLTKPDGKTVAVELPAVLLRAVQSVLGRLAKTGDLLLLNKDAELSPEQAAKILGVSRPMVYHRMDSGRLPFRPVGTHRRVRLEDVLKLREFERQRREVSKALSEDTDDLETNYVQPTARAARR